jgi:hypothetical protein
MKTMVILILVLIAGILMACAFSEGAVQTPVAATLRAIPTQTAYPTYTPYPTNTPYPTYTLYPTYTPQPTQTAVVIFVVVTATESMPENSGNSSGATPTSIHP